MLYRCFWWDWGVQCLEENLQNLHKFTFILNFQSLLSKEIKPATDGQDQVTLFHDSVERRSSYGEGLVVNRDNFVHFVVKQSRGYIAVYSKNLFFPLIYHSGGQDFLVRGLGFSSTCSFTKFYFEPEVMPPRDPFDGEFNYEYL